MPPNSMRLISLIEMHPIQSYNQAMKTLENALTLEKSNPALFRLRVIQHGEKYGWRAAIDAFTVSKSSYFRWRSRYNLSRQNALKLIPHKTKPKRLRTMKTNPHFIELIATMRREHANLSKYKLKPFVDALALELGIATISVTTIGKIIKRKGLFFDQESRLIPQDLRAKRKDQRKQRARRSPHPSTPGYLEIDSITTYINGKRFYFMCVIDVYSRVAQAQIVKSLSSQQALICLRDFSYQFPVKIRTVQTDNGKEFLGKFDDYLQRQSIQHIFTYPRCPRINGHIERFNRTIQEEFINRSEIYYDFPAFRCKLSKWLEFYNFKRPHQALNYLSPHAFLTSNIPKCV